MSKISAKLEKFKTNFEKLQHLMQTQKSNYLMYLTNPKFGLSFLLTWINDQTPLLNDPTYQLKTKIFWVLNGIHEFPSCEICGTPMENTNVKSVQKGYDPLICSKETCKSAYAQKKREATMLKHYGVTNNFARKEVMNTIKQNNVAKYGNACPANNKSIRAQIKQDNLKKYGCECYQSTDEFKNKVKQTVTERYGVNNVFKATAVKEKIKNTIVEKYGVEHISQSAAVKETTKKHLIEKYGENYKTILWGKPGNKGQSARAYNDYILKSQLVIPLFTLEQYVEERSRGNNCFQFKCKKCGKTFYSPWDNGMTKACPYCKITETGSSKKEYELYTEVLSCLEDECKVHHNDRSLLTNRELDVYVPDKKIAIEFDGLYWHNDDCQKNYRYHLEKTERCEEHGVQLVHIFENEWNHKHELVMSRLKVMFGIYDKIVFARKCEVREVNYADSENFQESNHLQGFVNAKVYLGLYYEDELISLMTFGKPRFNKNYEWELLRFCNKLGYHVPGGAGKLLAYFERKWNPKSLISYADRRWSKGKLYKALGFKLDHISGPNYWYFLSYECIQLESRVKFQKHKLKTMFTNFDPALTEAENMKNNGYHRIFDCGNLVYVKDYS